MEDIYTKIQVYLIKKDKECEKLRFLTSRTTPANSAHVTDVCETIKMILRDSQESPCIEKSIQHFKFLLLNTNFRAQEHLCEDITNGHLVDMCPPLSPYLFIQILWSLDYDDILSTSILYIPIDLCSEILDTLRRSLDLDFQRAFRVVLAVIANSYKKLVSMIHLDVQVLEEQESLKRFLGSIQELLFLLGVFQSRKIEDLSQLAKYERYGWVLIRLLNMTRDCITTKRAEDILSILDSDLEKIYRVTFGRDFIVKLDAEAIKEAVDVISQEIIELLLSEVKKIDCYVYMGWAELDYEDDTSISMQRAIGLACYHFIEFLEADPLRSEEYRHIIECLRQLSSRPDAPFSMNMSELCKEVEKGNNECLRKLIQRHEDWDSSAISCLDNNRSLIDKGTCLSLLKSTVKYLETSIDEELRTKVYGTAMKILLGQNLLDLVEIVVEFILIHDGNRELESTNFEADLKSYVNQGLALCSSKTSLRMILFFAIQNPREVLKTLIKSSLGYQEFANSVMLPEDFCKLSSIMQIREANNLSLLVNTLRTLCTKNIAWNGKKFINLIRVFLDKNLLTTEEVINDIFIPALRNEIILANIPPILTCLRIMRGDLTPRIKKRELLYVLALQMAYLRKNNSNLLRYSKEEVLNLLIRVIRYFLEEQMNYFVDEGEDLFVQKLESNLEPLDRIYFAAQWGWIRDEICIDQVLQEYKKRCLYMIKQSKSAKNCCANLEDFLEAHGLGTSDFLQHLILRCTEFEYLNIAQEILMIHWNYFGWENEVDAYAQFSLATTKACRYNLYLIDLTNPCEFLTQKFALLIKSLAKLTIWFINIETMHDYEAVYKSLVFAMNALDVSRSVCPDISRFCQELKTSFCRNIDTVYSYKMLSELISHVEKFGDQCLHECSQPVTNTDPKSVSAMQFYLNSTFISICSNWPEKENCLLSKIDKKLYSKHSHDIWTNVAGK